MDTDSTTTDSSFTVSTTWDADPGAQNVSITNTRRCSRVGCTAVAAPGSDYCRDHVLGGSIFDSDPDVPNITQPIPTKPSNRDLQRQLDRLEGKLDAILAALDIDVEDD